jgi:anti-anti-sigma factor
MQASIRRDASTVVLRIGGELDVATESALIRLLESAVRERPRVLVIDLADVTFISPRAVADLAAVGDEVPTRIINASPTAVRVAEILRVAHRFRDR